VTPAQRRQCSGGDEQHRAETNQRPVPSQLAIGRRFGAACDGSIMDRCSSGYASWPLSGSVRLSSPRRDASPRRHRRELQARLPHLPVGKSVHTQAHEAASGVWSRRPIGTMSVNERRSLDFVHDRLQSARRIRAHNRRRSAATHSQLKSIHRSAAPGMTTVLDRIADESGYPKTIVIEQRHRDNEFGDVPWAASHRVRLHYIEQGKPTQNAFIEKSKRPLPGRMPERARLPNARRGPADDRVVARGSQRSPAAQITRPPDPKGVVLHQWRRELRKSPYPLA
jgi:hypothetical protein